MSKGCATISASAQPYFLQISIIFVLAYLVCNAACYERRIQFEAVLVSPNFRRVTRGTFFFLMLLSIVHLIWLQTTLQNVPCRTRCYSRDMLALLSSIRAELNCLQRFIKRNGKIWNNLGWTWGVTLRCSTFQQNISDVIIAVGNCNNRTSASTNLFGGTGSYLLFMWYNITRVSVFSLPSATWNWIITFRSAVLFAVSITRPSLLHQENDKKRF